MYTSVYDPRGLPAEFRHWPVRTTFLQRLHWPPKYSRMLLPLMPQAFSALDLSEFDLVFSMSSAFSKNVSTRSDATNISYCLTPPRYLWDLHDQYIRQAWKRVAVRPALEWLRRKDLEAAARVDRFIAISKTVADRITSVYGRSSEVIYPPVDTARFQQLNPRPAGYFLVVSRLIRYKRIDLAIRACNATRRKLIVVGSGPMERELKAMAGPTIEFRGSPPDAEVTRLLAGCEAFLFPGLEDFGIAPVEAQAAGRPVIAFAQGGATETVRSGVTGVFFDEQTPDSLIAAIESFDSGAYHPQECRENAQRFDSSVFRSRVVNQLGLPAQQGQP
jgi:glycosyltransferase involved in cell wall biosynthesis